MNWWCGKNTSLRNVQVSCQGLYNSNLKKSLPCCLKYLINRDISFTLVLWLVFGVLSCQSLSIRTGQGSHLNCRLPTNFLSKQVSCLGIHRKWQFFSCSIWCPSFLIGTTNVIALSKSTSKLRETWKASNWFILLQNEHPLSSSTAHGTTSPPATMGLVSSWGSLPSNTPSFNQIRIQ